MGYKHSFICIDKKKFPVDPSVREVLYPIIDHILSRYKYDITGDQNQKKITPVTIKNDVIRFNALGNIDPNSDTGDCEEFYFNFKKPRLLPRCKGDSWKTGMEHTAGKPYDLVVCEILIILWHFLPAIEISSDGFSYSEEDGYHVCGNWLKAARVVKNRYGIATDLFCWPENPPGR